MPSSLKIAIAGLSGKMGHLITRALLDHHSDIEIKGIVRSSTRIDASLRENSKVQIFQTSADDSAAVRKALVGADVCICCYLGNDSLMIQGQKTLIDACIAERVPRYLASDYCFDFRGLKKGDHPAKDWMLETTAYLDEKERSGEIKGVHVLNGAFTETVFSPFIGYFDANANEGEGKFMYFGTGDEKIEMTTMKDTAAFVAKVALDSSANGYINVLGDRKSVKELANVYGEVYGLEPTTQKQGSLNDLAQKMRESFKQDPSNAFSWMGMYFQYYLANGSTVLGETENERLGDRKPQGVKEFLQGFSKENIASSYM